MNAGARPWRITPGPISPGTLTLPGDKSITHRAILFGLLAAGETVVRGGNPGADCDASLAAARALGAATHAEPGLRRITGTGGALREPSAPIDCGNSGTSLRLLSGILAGAPIHATLTGDDSLRSRPVDRVIAPLRAMGATLNARDGDRLPPLEIRGGGLRGVAFDTPTASAQVASAILLAGLAARGRTSVAVRAGVRDHTVHLLRAFGATVDVTSGEAGGSVIAIEGPQALRAQDIMVPGDPSAAAFFLALAAITPGLVLDLDGVNLSATRTGFLRVLERMGVAIAVESHGEAAGEPVGDLRVTGPTSLVATEIPADVVPSLVDEVPAWAMVAARARGVSRLAGAAELRVKESDRLKVLASNLRALGIEARDSESGLEIQGGVPNGGEVQAHHDHRIAMAFAVLATGARGPVGVDDAASVATSFPGFESTFRSLGGRIDTPAGGPS